MERAYQRQDVVRVVATGRERVVAFNEPGLHPPIGLVDDLGLYEPGQLELVTPAPEPVAEQEAPPPEPPPALEAQEGPAAEEVAPPAQKPRRPSRGKPEALAPPAERSAEEVEEISSRLDAYLKANPEVAHSLGKKQLSALRAHIHDRWGRAGRA